MRLSRRKLGALALLCAAGGTPAGRADAQAQAQTATELKVVTANLGTGRFDKTPPFDERFLLVVDLPEGVESIRIAYGERCEEGDSPRERAKYARGGAASLTAFAQSYLCAPTGQDPLRFRRALDDRERSLGGLLKRKQVSIEIQPLAPNRPYLFVFRLTGSASKAAPPTRAVDSIFVPRDAARAPRVDTIVVRHPAPPPPPTVTPVVEDVTIPTSAEASFATHFDSDLGVLHAFGPGWSGFNANAHFYVVPFNKREVGTGWCLRDPFKCASLAVGLASVKIDSEADIEYRFGSAGTPTVGLGLRPLMGIPESPTAGQLRVIYGYMLFDQQSANPVRDEKIHKRSRFLAATLNTDLKSLFGPIASLAGFK